MPVFGSKKFDEADPKTRASEDISDKAAPDEAPQWKKLPVELLTALNNALTHSSIAIEKLLLPRLVVSESENESNNDSRFHFVRIPAHTVVRRRKLRIKELIALERFIRHIPIDQRQLPNLLRLGPIGIFQMSIWSTLFGDRFLRRHGVQDPTEYMTEEFLEDD